MLLLLSSAHFALAADGVTEFSGEIAGRGMNASARDYRHGFASLVCIDMTTGYVFDHCATSDRTSIRSHRRRRLKEAAARWRTAPWTLGGLLAQFELRTVA